MRCRSRRNSALSGLIYHYYFSSSCFFNRQAPPNRIRHSDAEGTAAVQLFHHCVPTIIGGVGSKNAAGFDLGWAH